ncbi:hypothetical protein PR048_018706 [Dryococelus australis]|uniref:Uncharacterized protein n=1 Tax=Dryococelus australis TaxID=614101 RepID=A0ABQ9HDT1_9NEOP|nr:hypothetical protein PR048_018706 [Dryococelus australis]
MTYPLSFVRLANTWAAEVHYTRLDSAVMTYPLSFVRLPTPGAAEVHYTRLDSAVMTYRSPSSALPTPGAAEVHYTRLDSAVMTYPLSFVRLANTWCCRGTLSRLDSAVMTYPLSFVRLANTWRCRGTLYKARLGSNDIPALLRPPCQHLVLPSNDIPLSFVRLANTWRCRGTLSRLDSAVMTYPLSFVRLANTWRCRGTLYKARLGSNDITALLRPPCQHLALPRYTIKARLGSNDIPALLRPPCQHLGCRGNYTRLDSAVMTYPLSFVRLANTWRCRGTLYKARLGSNDIPLSSSALPTWRCRGTLSARLGSNDIPALLRPPCQHLVLPRLDSAVMTYPLSFVRLANTWRCRGTLYKARLGSNDIPALLRPPCQHLALPRCDRCAGTGCKKARLVVVVLCIQLPQVAVPGAAEHCSRLQPVARVLLPALDRRMPPPPLSLALIWLSLSPRTRRARDQPRAAARGQSACATRTPAPSSTSDRAVCHPVMLLGDCFLPSPRRRHTTPRYQVANTELGMDTTNRDNTANDCRTRQQNAITDQSRSSQLGTMPVTGPHAANQRMGTTASTEPKGVATFCWSVTRTFWCVWMKTYRVRFPAESLTEFRMWESSRTMLLIGAFTRRSPVSPAHAFRRCSVLAHFALPQDLNVKSGPNLPSLRSNGTGNRDHLQIMTPHFCAPVSVLVTVLRKCGGRLEMGRCRRHDVTATSVLMASQRTCSWEASHSAGTTHTHDMLTPTRLSRHENNSRVVSLHPLLLWRLHHQLSVVRRLV